MSSSFAELMKVAEKNSQSSQKEALEAAKRREAALRRAREEQEKKERDEKEQQRRLMLRRIDEEKKAEERKKQKEEEVRKRREEAMKGRAMDEELTRQLPLANREASSKSKNSSSYIVTNSTALTREEKRMARDPLRADELKANRRSATVKRRKDGRLPGGAINSQDASGSSSRMNSPASNGLSARARMSAQFAPTLMKLNTEKRDLRTIEEITRDLQRNKLGGGAEKEEVLNGDKAQGFVDWFSKKEKEKPKPISAEGQKQSVDNAGRSSKTAPPNGSSSAAKTSAPQRSATSASQSYPSSSTATKPVAKKVSAGPSRPTGSASTSKVGPLPTSANRKRPREHSASYDSDMLDDDESSEEDRPWAKRRAHGEGLNESARDMIWKLMGKDRSRYAAVDVNSDDDMEVSAVDLWKEDKRSTKLAKQEDAEAEAEDRRRELEKKKRKLEREKNERNNRGYVWCLYISASTAKLRPVHTTTFVPYPPTRHSFSHGLFLSAKQPGYPFLIPHRHSLIQNLKARIMKLLASVLAVSAGFVSLPLAACRNVHSSHENNGKSHIKRSHDLQKGFSGVATYFAVGLGACGGYSQPSDYIVAMNSVQYSGSCGKTLTITGRGKTMTATVADECPGCSFHSVDMSQGLFEYFAPTSVGEFSIIWNYGGAQEETTPTNAKSTSTSTPHTTPTPTSMTTTSSALPTTTTSASSLSSTSTSNTSTASASTPTDSTGDTNTETANQTAQSTGSNLSNQQKIVYNLGNMASYGKSQSS
ncbi:hypothetical protein FRB94_012489 [Tulasnella sp. JGI-2019a]|nr:hypothetical protein FRB94_012489 [Tulasnella sp. JGI-2019a]